MPYPSENDSCIDDGYNPAPDSASLLTINECRTSSGSTRNSTTKQLRALCHFSHGTMFALHVVLLLVYKFRAEHRITITTVTVADIVATVLAVSLQAFYTVYTAVLVFVTQRLALSYNFSRRQKLTSIHDIAGAWIGIGAALFGLWDQTKIKTSMGATIAVTVYLLSISALHITSSSIIQLQTFNATITVPVSTTIGWPEESVDPMGLIWSSIDPFIPATSQLATLSTVGISSSTVYDLVSRNSGFGEAIVNATTVSASCGLFNLPAIQNMTGDSVAFQLETNIWLTITSFPQTFWKDQIRMFGANRLKQQLYSPEKDPSSFNLNGDIFVMTSTAIDLGSSVLNPTTILANWTYVDQPNMNTISASITKIFMVGCTLSTNTRETYVDVQTNELSEVAPLPDVNKQWTPWMPQNTPPTLYNAISGAIEWAAPSSLTDFECVNGPNPNASPSVLDTYIMSLLGLNAAAVGLEYCNESSSNPNFTLSRYQLESAVAQIAAEAMWMTGQVGQEGGGFSRSTGETSVTQYLLQWRLNINLAPLIVATLASFIAFILAIEMTGRMGTHKPDGSQTVKSASPLELLWLAAHMPGLTTGFKDVESPTMNNLREAGMFDVCLTADDIKVLDDDLNKGLGS